MTDSTPPIPSTVQRVAERPQTLSRDEQALKIISVTGELQNLRRAVRVDGVVKAIARDGTAATIETDRGTIEVRLPERTSLQTGQKIEVDLPPGQPPRQIIVRPQANPAPQQQQTPTPQPLPDDVAPGPAPQPSTPLPPQVREILDRAAPPPLAVQYTPGPVTPDTITRIIPLPALPPADQLLPQATPIPVTPAPQAVNGASMLPLPAPPIAEQPAITSPPPAPLTPVAMPLPDDVTLLPQAESVPGTIATKLPDPAPLQKPSITLPLREQIFPFIKPVKAGPVAPLPDKIDIRTTAIRPGSMMEIPSFKNTIPQSPLTVTADVVATTVKNFPVLSIAWPGETEASPFLMQFPATNLPIGSQIELSTQIIAGPQSKIQPVSTAATAFELLTGFTWPVFDDAIQMIAPNPAAIQAQQAQSFVNVLPNPGNPQQMPSAMMFLMAAIGANDLSGWMGEKAINALRREGAKGNDILNRLNRDFAGLNRMMDDPVAQDWKAMSIPMMWQGDISRIHLYYRHQKNDDENAQDEKKEGGSTRFIFDLSLSKIGPVQLDGYMKGKRFDLILRTQTPFSHTMQSVMRKRYLDTIEAGALTGDLAFQHRADQWVTVNARNNELLTSA